MGFVINKASSVPIHIQLREQIQYAVASGLYGSGEAMPSINELAGQLGIHRNTVHRVYLELQTIGILVSRPGKGMFVSPRASQVHSRIDYNKIEAFLQEFFERAQDDGLHPALIGRLASQRAATYDQSRPSFAFVECTLHDAVVFARRIEEEWNVAVPHVLLEDLRSGTGSLPDSARDVITSFFHVDELRPLLDGARRRIHPVTYDLDPNCLAQVRALTGPGRIGLLCKDANTEDIYRQLVGDAVPVGIEVETACVEEADRAVALLGSVATLCFTPAAIQFVLASSRPELELIEMQFDLNQNSVDNLRRKLLPAF